MPSVSVVFSMALSLSGSGGHAAEPQKVDVFVGGQDGIREYRIPALVASNRGTLVAVCDARVSKPGDAPNNIDLVMKRSLDGGRTWSALQVLKDYPGEEAACDPCLLVDRQTGALWLFYDYAVPRPGTAEDRELELYVMKSDDDGLTWGPAVNLSSVLRPPGGRSLYAAPGAGIQMRSGRLVAPVYSHLPGDREHSCHVVLSDDHGQTWKLGAGIGTDQNEHQVVELQDGALLTVMRQGHGRGCRAVARSHDGGETWTAFREERTLVEPGCQGSVLRYTWAEPQGRSRILFSNPANATARNTGTLRLTYDEGETWPVAKVILPGSFGYSCLAALADGTIGCLFETEGYAKITFASFSLDWLTEGKDRLP